MSECRLIYYCENCCIGFEVTFNPCIGLEVKRHVACPHCDKEFTFTILVTAQMEDEWRVT